jgi:hypothetical protein
MPTRFGKHAFHPLLGNYESSRAALRLSVLQSVGLQVMLLCPCIIHKFTQTWNQRSANESTPQIITMRSNNSHSPICWTGSIIVHFVSQLPVSDARRKKSRLSPPRPFWLSVVPVHRGCIRRPVSMLIKGP